ncbi:hypothetical protein DRO64_05280 [Candidatus Bathyarchaeota archaeon]|nr:MAG: hypothetical protein DRO64_05280 [Candidatus Bathyarchaeota archaeon]
MDHSGTAVKPFPGCAEESHSIKLEFDPSPSGGIPFSSRFTHRSSAGGEQCSTRDKELMII